MRAIERQVEEVVALVVSIEASGSEGSVKPFANMKLRGGLQAEVVGIVEVGLLHNDSHSVTGLIGKLGEIVGLKLCKGRESIFAIQLPHQVEIVASGRLQIRVAPDFTICRRVIDATHCTPIGGVDGFAAE